MDLPEKAGIKRNSNSNAIRLQAEGENKSAFDPKSFGVLTAQSTKIQSHAEQVRGRSEVKVFL